METLTVQQLIDAGVHFGCRVSRWNPKMAPYIHGRRNLIHVIDLRQTLRGIIRAQNLLYHIAAEGQSVLWVGTKRQVKGVIQDAGQRTGMPIVTERWIGGTLTNFVTIRASIDRLRDIENRMAEEESPLTKKERLRLERERAKMQRNLEGIREMDRLPDALFVVDPKREHIAVAEANKLRIPVIAIVDTNCDPDPVDYPIPGNDDAIRAITVITKRIADACVEGLSRRKTEMPAQEQSRGAGPEVEVARYRGSR